MRDREEDTDKILSATGLVKALTAGLAVLLVFASIALIANTIRLSIFARRREVEVMKLVGATNWFIRWPFVIEGVIVGLMGGLLAVLLLTIAKETFIDPLSERFALLAAPETIDFPLLIVVLLLSLHRRVGARQRHHAAPLPARLSRPLQGRFRAATTLSGRMNSARSALVAFLCAVVALCVGIWLGGHPETCPGRSATPSWTRTARCAPRSSTRSRTTSTSKVDDEQARRCLAQGDRRALDDRFSHYLTPEGGGARSSSRSAAASRASG